MVLTYTKPSKEWVLKTGADMDGDSLSYVDMMERSSVEERRRQRERAIMEEGKALWMAKKGEQLELELREQEQIREMTRSKMFGRPGHGAPTLDIRKKKFTEYQLTHGENHDDVLSLKPNVEASEQYHQHFQNHNHNYNHNHNHNQNHNQHPMAKEEPSQDALTFGRPGCGAPVRTRSGRIKTFIIGNPEIRFQANESVQKTICNAIRYQTDKESKELYQRALEEQISQRKIAEKMEKEQDVNTTNELVKMEASQWGRPGPGGAYWRNSTVTGQRFFENMGWCGSADPRKRTTDVKQHETEDMKKDVADHYTRKAMEEQEINSNVGVELVPLFKEKVTGRPKKDPATGYMLNHSLPSTDVTKMAEPKRSPNSNTFPSDTSKEYKKMYYETLSHQVQKKESEVSQNAKDDEDQQRMHFQSWETFWGRPGYGAPQDGKGPQKENLMKLLHYPTQKSPNNVELITLERLSK